MEVEGRLVPVMREGINVVKMIFFKKLNGLLSGKYPDQDKMYVSMLSGAILNDLFGTLNPEEPFKSFTEENRSRIEEELGCVAAEFEDMRIPLTDALRMQFLCDSQEGNDSSAVMSRAEELGIMLKERDLPLPHHFMELVRRLGSAFNLIVTPGADKENNKTVN